MHERHELQCVFGCDAADTWAHYLFWPVLWLALLECVGLPYNSDPMQRIGMCMVTSEGVLALGTAFSVYRASKQKIISFGRRQNAVPHYESILEL